jgi:hypothetical protein
LTANQRQSRRASSTTRTRAQLQLDIVVTNAGEEIIAIGEAKSGEIMGGRHLQKLRRGTELLRSQGRIPADAQPRLLFMSGSGFTPGLVSQAAESHGKIQLIGLERLYTGS